jgi:hypothetical protein
MTETQRGETTSVSSGDLGLKPLSSGTKWKFAGLALLVFSVLFSMLWMALNPEPKSGLGVILSTPLAARTPGAPNIIRAFPETLEGIHVFSDQLATWEMSEAQFEFAATHYVGTQKVFASDARRLRARNPNFIILNYRLGLGLGYRTLTGDCEPGGQWLEVIEGEKWVREYPENPPDEWFFKSGGQRVLFCDWGWYLMNLSNPSWREYWAGEVLRQLRANAADGLFVDSLFPPNYYGGDKFNPHLPDLDPAFESAWSTQIEALIAFGQSGDLADYYFIPNAGTWVNGRDETDYSGADGLMVEGFGRWPYGEYFLAQDGDWQLQMDRVLGMVNLDKIVLLQQMVRQEDLPDRLFLLGSYLLVKGRHTYLNLELSTVPEWFPEYEIPIGTPVGGLPASISSLWRPDWELYARNYSQGLVLVNPSDKIKEVTFQKTYYQAVTRGGGMVPTDGDLSGWGVDYLPVTRVSLGPNQAVILLEVLPGQ